MVLSITKTNYFQLLNIVGFISLIILPGLLTIFAIGIKKLDFWGYIGLAIGLSLLELMAVGLLGNTFLPFMGVVSPLGKGPFLLEFSFLIFSLLVIAWMRRERAGTPTEHHLLFDNYRDFILAFAPAVFVLMSILGAIRLNNGGDNTITFIMLIGIAIYSAVLIRYSNRVGPNVIPIALFFVSLALLFMTSLRGWYTTGHDVQREYRVFELAKNSGIWSIQSFRDAYNACMSITILPTIFYRLLKFPDPYVYKVFFQIIFAVVPGVLYLTVRRYATAMISFLSVLYFIAFPTFFGDMPMLNRQEIAFLFLALMSYVIFEQNVSIRMRRALFTILGFGMVLSHYTTTYTVIAMLLFLLCARPVVERARRYAQKKSILADSAIETFGSPSLRPKKHITVGMVLALAFASFLWSSVLTDTSSNSIYRVVTETIKVIKNNTREDAKSGDVLYNLFSWRKFDTTAELAVYNNKIVLRTRASAPAGTYYSASTYEKYPIETITDNTLPLTSIGKIFASTGLNVVSFNYIFRQASAKILQILVVVGLFFVVLKKEFLIKLLDTEFVLLAGGSLVLVLSQIILPVLSVEYGVLRAFQQSLFFLSIFIVVGSLVLVGKFKNNVQIIFSGALAIILFLSSTGVLTQILGGYGPQLHLNNDGTYYDIYYLHETEVVGISWLASKIANKNVGEYQSEVQSDRYSFSKVKSLSDINILNDIHPGLIRKDSYVYLGFANVHKQQATLSYNSNLITYTYPIQFLDDSKDLVYSNGGVKIFR